jgi:CRP/FNR family transcriptional regulator, cyclic AMP receptor protein
MISPERLRRYPFFGVFDDAQLKAIAMISEELELESGKIVFKAGEKADIFYLLEDGLVDLSYIISEQLRPEQSKEFSVGEINSGEPFSLHAVVEPYIFTATARTAKPCKLIQIDAIQLRGLCDVDSQLAYKLMHQIAKSALDRLAATRIQLAAAWA